mmetsp:Transcript_57707/g.132486  ORF Transcript_57707/g.132486 Transcript_57707/m.132486 type:complete len:736 (-) Transcript_57707:343-2550(-)|eukprot:CAMPEP_0119358182 /NCGR_PEP_ID=MMETSP1334-20130426/6437_1 /TAXON_ID=127549 /ORGANISM="Calcidiscus leptoporus, Strain RCC1130" /LENGTH=735 /DNA_ID=CAMNT_0007372615 /DNA_START=259 /DNA_END=2466 /DNA_ORIENTATION=-
MAAQLSPGAPFVSASSSEPDGVAVSQRIESADARPARAVAAKSLPEQAVPSDDLLAMISNDSPADLGAPWAGGGAWHTPELFNGRSAASVHTKPRTNGHKGACAPSGANGAAPAAVIAQPLPGGNPSSPLHSGLSALAPPPQPAPLGATAPTAASTSCAACGHNCRPVVMHPHMGLSGGAGVRRTLGQNPLGNHVQGQAQRGAHGARNGAVLAGCAHAQNPMVQQQQLIASMHQQYKERDVKICAMQSSLAATHHALQGREDEVARLQKTIQERDEEIARLNAGAQKLQKAKESEMASLKTVLQKEKEEKLAKLNAAHNKRIDAREEEFVQMRTQWTRDKDKEATKLSAVHQKQLKAKEDELNSARKEVAREKDERIAKLVAANKELKSDLAIKDQEVANMRRQMASAQKAEEELRKQQASAASRAQREETATKDSLTKLRGSIEQAHVEEMRKLEGAHEEVVVAKDRELANLSAQLKQTLQRYQQTQTALQRERDQVKEALLDSRNMAEVSMHFSVDEEEALLNKVKQRVYDCSLEEVHWLMTKTFRTWLAQSYTECDEVCDAHELEQQRLKRISQYKDTEICKMRARLGFARGRIGFVYQVFLLSMFANMFIGIAGASVAFSTHDVWETVQIMGLGWLVTATTAVMVLIGTTSSPRLPSASDARGGGTRAVAQAPRPSPDERKPNGATRRGEAALSSHAREQELAGGAREQGGESGVRRSGTGNGEKGTRAPA